MMRTLGLFVAVVTLAALPIESASAAVFVYQASLDGPSEFPANGSPGTGFAQLTYDDVSHMLTVQASFQGLIGTTTAAHIHAPVLDTGNPTAGVATQTPSFTNFPLGVTSGVMPATAFDLTLASSWNPTYVSNNGGTTAGAEAAFIAALNNQPAHPNFPSRAYFNIHSTAFPGGEIRGFLQLIPEPSALSLGALSMLGLLWGAKQRAKARARKSSTQPPMPGTKTTQAAV